MIPRGLGMLFLAWQLAGAATGLGSEPEPEPGDLPRIPPLDPADAMAGFMVRPGFRIEQTASEPLVVDPIALSFDEHGRLFVAEMRDYSERREERLGRIRLLEDTDSDGRFDRGTVYVEGLPWPTAVFAYGGGVFVGATPDLLYCRDTDGDGVADIREVVFTGFAGDAMSDAKSRLNVQAMLNSLQWGLDNRIHGAASLSGGRVRRVDSPFVRAWLERGSPPLKVPTGGTRSGLPGTGESEPEIDLRGRDFSFDPRTLGLRAETGGGQHGMSFDSQGRKFVCSNSDHIQLVMYEARDVERNPMHLMPPARLSIAADGPAAEVFRTSPDEPWRLIRTRWRVAGLVTGPIEGGGRASGYFTGATGVTIYRGDAFPVEYHGNAFIADCGSNLIHRKRLEPDDTGIALVAKRAGDEARKEFLTSADNWFRPVQFANGPDGALHVADMYREVIEHPWSLPESIKRHLDLNSGNDRGRLYRIVPDGFQQPRRPTPGNATTSGLVAMLEHPNGWHRDTAARLLHERLDATAIPLARRLARESLSAEGRVHALCVLDGMGALEIEDVLHAIRDASAGVRRMGVVLSRAFAGASEAPLAPALASLATDASPWVRYRLALSLGNFPALAGDVEWMGAFLRRDAGNSWIRAALLSAPGVPAGRLFTTCERDAGFASNPSGQDVLNLLAGVIGSQGIPADVSLVIEPSDRPKERWIGAIDALADGLRRSGRTFDQVLDEHQLRALRSRVATFATDPKAMESIRLQAVRILAGVGADSNLFITILDHRPSEALQAAVVEEWGRTRERGFSEAILVRWANLPERARARGLEAMLANPDRASDLLDAIESGRVQRSELSVAQAQNLRTHRDPALRSKSLALLGNPPSGSRLDKIQELLPALKLEGRTSEGQRIHIERCAPCHRFGDQGFGVGPDLATLGSKGKEWILVNIVDPNREVAPGYMNCSIETHDNEIHTGLIVEETPARIALRGPGAAEVSIPRTRIAKIHTPGSSLMPEGLEEGLSAQDIADLIAYLESGAGSGNPP